ncbi:hypothetical protein K438DRAFT_1835445 [Mycena galopus ATCC 62051]|nr:hypothetical protein K438DRAFT_1835445 [Mycena galopus ATCC 62051]
MSPAYAGAGAKLQYPLTVLLQEIIPDCEQWRDIVLYIPDGNPRLFDALPDVVESFTDAPQLKELYLIAESAKSVVLPWQQLTKLTCENFTDIESVAALRRCPAIVDCSFVAHYLMRSMESITSLPPLVHHCITSLKIDGIAAYYNDADILVALFALFPVLRKLDMDLDLEDWRKHDWAHGLMREMILSRCLGSATRQVSASKPFAWCTNPMTRARSMDTIPG